MPKARSEKGGPRGQRQAYHLTCSNCRTRKMRCDGGQPRCGICVAYDDECIYDKPPPMSQIIAMADKVAQLEKTIEELRMSQSNSSDPGSSTNLSATAASITRNGPMLCGANPRTSFAHDVSPTANSDAYYSSTSAVQDPRQPETVADDTSHPDNCKDPAYMSGHAQFWEEAAVQTASLHLQLPQSKVAHLIKTHWLWVHPTFMFIPRLTFLRDCAIGGPLFSPTLLSTICLHSTRFTDHHLSHELAARVRLLLGQDIHKEPSIPTVQSLLQLSAWEIGKGSVSQGWLYSGMAFRSAIDLGIFSESQRSLDSVMGHIRRRLAWSCFLWDKAVSLYLGRCPNLTVPPPFAPEKEIPSDCPPEFDMWMPYLEESSSSYAEHLSTQSHTHSCFANLCKLGVIIGEILTNLYNVNKPKDIATITSHIKKARKDLDSWRTASPPHLKIDQTSTICPPPHILIQNLLYFTTVILVHRPFWEGNEPCRTACREASIEVEHLLLLLERTMGFTHVTYMMSYCAYTAATIAVEDMKRDVPGSQKRVNTYLRALYGCRDSCPGIQRSIDIAMKSFDSVGAKQEIPARPESSTNLPNMQTVPPLPMDHGMPAFPFAQWQGTSFDFPVGLDPNADHFTTLDGFPQQWSTMDSGQFNDFSFS